MYSSSTLHPEPFEVFADSMVKLQPGALHFGVSVFEAQNEFAVVNPRVLVAQQYSSGRTQMQDAVGVRRKTRHNLLILVSVWQRRQTLFFFNFLFLLDVSGHFSATMRFCSSTERLLTSSKTSLIKAASSLAWVRISAFSPRILPTIGPVCALPSCRTAFSKAIFRISSLSSPFSRNITFSLVKLDASL